MYMAFITIVSETWSARLLTTFGFKGFLPVEGEGVQKNLRSTPQPYTKQQKMLMAGSYCFFSSGDCPQELPVLIKKNQCGEKVR